MSKSSFPSDQQDKFMLRLPDGMRDRIKVLADANKRSMNAEIVNALEQYLRPSFKIDTGEPLTDADFNEERDPDLQMTPEVRAAIKSFVQEITDDTMRRLNQWLWVEKD